jgi:hypothetical protein
MKRPRLRQICGGQGLFPFVFELGRHGAGTAAIRGQSLSWDAVAFSRAPTLAPDSSQEIKSLGGVGSRGPLTLTHKIKRVRGVPSFWGRIFCSPGRR